MTSAAPAAGSVGRARPYRALAGVSLRSTLAYRMQFFMGTLSSVFAMVTMLYLWHAVLANGSQAGFSWPQMKAYLLVSAFAGSLVSLFTDYRMAMRIRDGEVALDLTKPVDYQRARFAEALGTAVFECLIGGLVVGISLIAVRGVPLPSAGAGGLFVVSIALVMPLKFCMVYSTGLLCFWTQNYMGINWARLALATILSGTMVPLAFFPTWLRDVAFALPFQGMASTPALIYLGRLHGAAAVGAIGVQVFWVVVLWGLARLAWNAASRRLTIHGG